MFETTVLFIIGIILILTAPLSIWLLLMYRTYTHSTYKKETGYSFFRVIRDKGFLGEYYTATELGKLPGYHKMVMNAYLVNGKGRTTEVDIVFIHQKGVFVIESKNYSGWVFGSEKDKYWTVTLPNRHKERFYNPIMQNQGHIKALKNVLPFVSEKGFKSIIVFSKRCELKKISLDSNDVDVIVLKRNHLNKTMKKQFKKSGNLFTKEEVEQIYRTLKPYSQVKEEIKESHIKNVEKYKKGKFQGKKRSS